MQKYSFKDDYSEGAHPEILNVLSNTNYIQTIGYGEDEFSDKARQLIKNKIQNADVDIHFVSGGTQANLLVISSILKPYQSVIAATTAHIAVHETGAIEATGHKINTVETTNGKLKPSDIQGVLNFHTDEHMVMPKLVFISNSTEIGTVYSKKELSELFTFCKKNNLYLYLDGARIASALTSESNNLNIKEVSEYTDAFYIGGTKNGALLGEAIVIKNDNLKDDFRFQMKQKGALLAKGRLIGIQFLSLFKNDLYFDLAKHANQTAEKLAEGIKNKGYEFFTEPVTNQIFPIFPDKLIEKLHKKYDFYVWSHTDKMHSAVRLICSWATKEEFVDKFINDLD
ncbi:MAG: threonine aldolase [Bacteroidetes bacterium]|nr:MAG: threonine aldolase [Bacteroidota bacterium]